MLESMKSSPIATEPNRIAFNAASKACQGRAGGLKAGVFFFLRLFGLGGLNTWVVFIDWGL